jgi:ATP-binding cassette, subfamily B, vacuolar membrane transporter HMT1/ACLQ
MVLSSGVASTAHIVSTKSPLIPLAWAERILHYTHFLYPIVLLLFFGVGFAIHGVISAGNGPTLPPPPNVTGPGGKPLPTRRPSKVKVPQKESVSTIKRLLFIWIGSGLIATFVGNAINIVVRVLVERKDGWWCGEATAVSWRTNLCLR